jgi:hypothetical protein
MRADRLNARILHSMSKGISYAAAHAEATHYEQLRTQRETSVQTRMVIETKLEKRGAGTAEDPIRIITQYWSLDGELLAERDPRSGIGG